MCTWCMYPCGQSLNKMCHCVPYLVPLESGKARKGLRLLADDRSSPTGVSEDRIETRGKKRHKVT